MRSSGSIAVVAVLVLLFLPVLYVLSIGPAVFMYDRHMLSPSVASTLETIYSPLEWASNQSKAIEYPLNSYIQLWASRDPSPAPPPATMPVTAVMPAPTPTAPTPVSPPQLPSAPTPAEAEAIAP